MLIWDGASYHLGEKMKELLAKYNVTERRMADRL